MKQRKSLKRNCSLLFKVVYMWDGIIYTIHVPGNNLTEVESNLFKYFKQSMIKNKQKGPISYAYKTLEEVGAVVI